MSRVTLGTVAQEMGLSKFAVSRALAGKSGVSDETRRKVVAVAAELGYVKLAGQSRPPSVALIFNDTDYINSELQLMVQSGVQAEAKRRGYHVVARWTHDADEVEATMRSCQAGILVGPHVREIHDRIYAIGIPIVRTSGFPDPLEAVDIVTGPDHEAGAAIAKFLVDLGHREIAYVHGAPRYRGRIERLYGAREVLEGYPDACLHDMRFEPELTFAQALQSLLASGVEPTAFFCAHDGLAVTVVSELLRLGFRIPDDVTVVGFGDFSSATQISPQLTTVTLPGQEMGACCIRLLDDRLNDRVAPDQRLRVTVAGRMVIRASSGPLAQRPSAKPRSRSKRAAAESR
jgi:LacI family transcriptional regulator